MHESDDILIHVPLPCQFLWELLSILSILRQAVIFFNDKSNKTHFQTRITKKISKMHGV